MIETPSLIIGERTFPLCLGPKQLFELESGVEWIRNPGFRASLLNSAPVAYPTRTTPAQLLARLRSGEGTWADVGETIRLALIGGGAGRYTASELIREHVGDDHLPLAIAVLEAATNQETKCAKQP